MFYYQNWKHVASQKYRKLPSKKTEATKTIVVFLKRLSNIKIGQNGEEHSKVSWHLIARGNLDFDAGEMQ